MNLFVLCSGLGLLTSLASLWLVMQQHLFKMELVENKMDLITPLDIVKHFFKKKTFSNLKYRILK